MAEEVDEYGLSPKKRRFVERYIVDFDEEAAAQDAGFDLSTVPALLAHPLVKKAAEDLNKKRIESLKMTLDEAEIHLKQMAEPCFSDFYEQGTDGEFKVKADIDPEKLAAVKEIRTNKDGSQTLVFYNKDLLLDKVLRRHGAYVSKHEITGRIDHKHEHTTDVTSLIAEFNKLLSNRKKVIQGEVIDVEPEENARISGY